MTMCSVSLGACNLARGFGSEEWPSGERAKTGRNWQRMSLSHSSQLLWFEMVFGDDARDYEGRVGVLPSENCPFCKAQRAIGIPCCDNHNMVSSNDRS
jgi:hypothetical protein